ncbi:MAG TPA: cysteine-rich CWC family protein [Blastocatellia bacterium]|nr:cysteine-rich CWC family protein [Blastocatellia bacterium]
MLRELTEFILPSKRAPRECEACGQTFDCGASIKGCWCFSIKLSAEVRQELRGRYKDCLCRKCLMQFSRSQSPDIEKEPGKDTV